MTKADLVEKVAERTGLTRTDVAVVVDGFLEAIKSSMQAYTSCCYFMRLMPSKWVLTT